MDCEALRFRPGRFENQVLKKESANYSRSKIASLMNWMTANLGKGLASTAMAHSPLATQALAHYYFWDSGMTDSSDPESTLEPDS